ncbi:hypothetical protein ACJX0J_005943, partial [Zea mays]
VAKLACTVESTCIKIIKTLMEIFHISLQYMWELEILKEMFFLMGFKYTELSVTNNKEFEELVLNFNLSNLHSFIISMMLLFTSEEGTGNHFIGSAIKETYSWKDGEGKNKSPQKAQWHKLKRKVEYQACMWPVFVIPYNFPPWVCLQDLWLGVNTIDARAGKEFILHATPKHKDLRISYLIFDYWALHICLDITVCSALTHMIFAIH